MFLGIYSSMRYDMIWYDLIWYDMIWFDMIWWDKEEIMLARLSLWKTRFKSFVRHMNVEFSENKLWTFCVNTEHNNLTYSLL